MTPKGDFWLVIVWAFFVNFFMHSTKWYQNGNGIVTFYPKYPKWDQNLHAPPPPRGVKLGFVNVAKKKLPVRRASTLLSSDQPYTDWQAYTKGTH